MDAYNEICGHLLIKIYKITNSRKIKIKERFKELKSLDKFIELFEKIIDSDFLVGKNSSGWKVSFGWIMKNDTNYLKVLEGQYDGKKSNLDTIKEIYDEFKQEEREEENEQIRDI